MSPSLDGPAAPGTDAMRVETVRAGLLLLIGVDRSAGGKRHDGL